MVKDLIIINDKFDCKDNHFPSNHQRFFLKMVTVTAVTM